MPKIIEDTPKDFNLVILSGKCDPESPFASTYENSFALWKDIWMEVLQKTGSPQTFNPDIFFRTEFIPVILYKGEAIGLFFAGVYPINSVVTANHSYFSIFPRESVQLILKRNVKNLMSYEYLTVSRQWRKPKLGFSLAAVLIELGLYLRKEIKCDAAVGVASKKAGIHQLAHDNGALPLVDHVVRGNLECEIVAFFPERDKESSDHMVNRMCAGLWQTRVYINRRGQILNLINSPAVQQITPKTAA